MTIFRRALRAVQGAQARTRQDEDGIALVVTMGVITTLFLAAFAFMLATTGSVTSAGRVSDIVAARSMAEAGLSDALFRIDQEGTTLSSFCVGPSASCTVSSIPAEPGVEYKAVLSQSVADVFDVQVLATDKGQSYAISAEVTKQADYPFPIFAGSSVTFNGQGKGGIVATDKYGKTESGVPADVGSNGMITCNGGGADGTAQVPVGAGAGTSGCTNAVPPSASTYSPQQPILACPASVTTPPTPCMPSSNQVPCPSGGTFSGTVEPGVYNCTTGVTFSGTVNVDTSSTANGGDVEIFVSNVDNATAVELRSSVVNEPVNTSGGLVGDPTQLQIYVKGTGCAIDPGNGANAGSVDAILYAPGCAMDTAGSHLFWDGAMTLGSFTGDGNPNLHVHYDVRAAALVEQGWQVSNFQQLAPSSFSLGTS